MRLAFAMVLACAGVASAQHQDVVITAVDGVLTTQSRVYGADLGEIVPNFGDEPGYESETLPAFAGIGFDLLDAARVWDGSDFDAVSASTVRFDLAPGVPGSPSVATPVAPASVAGFVIATADEFGSLHQHLGMTLNSPADPGIYLVQLRLWESTGALAASAPIWFVLNNGADEAEHDAAMAYAETVIVPSPGVGMVVGVVGLCGGRRRAR